MLGAAVAVFSAGRQAERAEGAAGGDELAELLQDDGDESVEGHSPLDDAA